MEKDFLPVFRFAICSDAHIEGIGSPGYERLKRAIDYSLDFASAYPEITSAMLILITFVPAAGCILQALPIHGYSLDEKQHAKILEELEEIRANNAK